MLSGQLAPVLPERRQRYYQFEKVVNANYLGIFLVDIEHCGGTAALRLPSLSRKTSKGTTIAKLLSTRVCRSLALLTAAL
jgi:hypothetical protein